MTSSRLLRGTFGGTMRGTFGACLLGALMTAMSGCTASATVGGGTTATDTSPPTCGADQSVAGCVGGSTGYSCTGSEGPSDGNASLNCSGGTPGNGATLYCCIDTSSIATGCSADSSITTCTGSAFGFSCTGTDRPDQSDSSLVCSAGVAGTSGVLQYCCASYVASSSTCTEDTTVQCGASVIGFTCTGSDSPDQANASLSCSSGTASGTGTQFCCATGSGSTTMTTTDTCAVDGSVSCSGTTGYTCSGSATPMQTDATLSCGGGTAGATAGSTSFCCQAASSTTSACAADGTVTCTAPSTGYTCTGNATPDPSLSCGAGEANGSAMSYCCNTATASNGCMQDSTVTGCPAGADGYSCTGSTSPETTTLLCGAGTAGSGGVTDYCCTTNM